MCITYNYVHWRLSLKFAFLFIEKLNSGNVSLSDPGFYISLGTTIRRYLTTNILEGLYVLNLLPFFWETGGIVCIYFYRLGLRDVEFQICCLGVFGEAAHMWRSLNEEECFVHQVRNVELLHSLRATEQSSVRYTFNRSSQSLVHYDEQE